MKIRLWAVSLAAFGILAFGTPRPLQAQQRQRVTADVAPPLSASRDVKADEEPGVPKGETYADMVALDAAPGRFPDKAPAGAGQPIASSPASIDSKPAEFGTLRDDVDRATGGVAPIECSLGTL